MSIIVERAGAPDQLLPIDPDWTIEHLAAVVSTTLSLTCGGHALRLLHDGRDLGEHDAHAKLADVGLVGADERVEAAVRAEHVVRAELSMQGVTERNAVAHAAAAASAGDGGVVRAVIVSGMADCAKVLVAVATVDELGVLDGMEGVVPEGAWEEAFAVSMRSRGDRVPVSLRLARRGLNLMLGWSARQSPLTVVGIQRHRRDFQELVETLLAHGRNVHAAFENIEDWPWLLRFASEALQGDREFVLRVVEADAHGLAYASAALRDDEEFMRRAVKIRATVLSGGVFKHASPRLRGDRDLFLHAVRADPECVLQASAELRADKDLMVEALRINPDAFRCMKAVMRWDREIALAAVRGCGMLLRDASIALRGDREVVLAAVQNDPHAITVAMKCVLADSEIMLAVAAGDWRLLRLASHELRDSKEFMMGACALSLQAVQWASPRLQGDAAFRMPMVGDARCLQNAGVLREDKAFVLAAVQGAGPALRYAAPALQRDPDVVRAAVAQSWKALEHATGPPRTDRDILAGAVRQCAKAMKYVPKELKGDREFMAAGVAVWGRQVARHATGELKEELMQAAAEVPGLSGAAKT